MDCLPLALAINGLDGLYGQTLLRLQHLPRFRDIISTVTLLEIMQGSSGLQKKNLGSENLDWAGELD
jgi:hypothetical protein